MSTTDEDRTREQRAHQQFVADARRHVARAHASIPGITADAHAEAARIITEATAEVDALTAKRDALLAEVDALERRATATRAVLEHLRQAAL